MSESPQQTQQPTSGRSQRTSQSTDRDRDRDFDSDLGLSPGPSHASAVGGAVSGSLTTPFESGLDDQVGEGMEKERGMSSEEEDEAVHFCLLAEFDIDTGATLADQYPHPTGTDEQ